MKKIFPFLFTIFLFSCTSTPVDKALEEKKINVALDTWNQDAAKANYTRYFNFLTDDAVFIGTDANENWVKKDFMVWAKPYFDKGKAWNFTALQRHIFFNESGTLAWFDELLNTQMKICRGSGVLVKIGPDWKLKQYVLSMTVPNDSMAGAIRIKSPVEDPLILHLQKAK